MNSMLKQSLLLQWKASRWAILPFVILSFGLPLIALRQSYATSLEGGYQSSAHAMLSGLQMWSPLFPFTAALLGVTIGLVTWNWDHRSNHVYPLSLPVARWEYALLKFAAGAAVLLIPVGAALAGTLLGLSGVEVPEGLHAYPLAFTLRFLLAALITFAICFAIAAGTMKTAIWTLSLFLGFLIFGTLAVGFAQDVLGFENLVTPVDLMNDALVHFPGPLHVFGGNWMLIDV